ncbi:variant erythrocyte surface antigen-1, beta subunit [Babesia caballi]|uniref:Variant erythrocyte surface antigen-1, beta subunit n=1 Tax=Babesia caballi TaxID=5871 RepID=A0AAV4LUF6_BABCB|nr:variant erythrocyte surface antigen-1, beta subunit [Babesia caballi]
MSSNECPYDTLLHQPKNLKEAIDWVLRGSGYDFRDGYKNGGRRAIRELASEIFSKLSSDDSVVKNAINRGFTCADGIQAQLFGKLGIHDEAIKVDFKLNEDDTSLVKVLPTAMGIWLKDDIQSYDGPITEFAQGLAKFIGWDENGCGTINRQGIASCHYKSAYDKYSDPWWLSDSSGALGVSIFVEAVLTTFLLLTYLFWQCYRHCTTVSCVKCGEWSQKTFCDGKSEVGSFLKATGFEDFKQLTTCSTVKPHKPLKASVIAGRLSYAFPEFSRVMAGLMGQRYPTYKDFISTLIKGVMYESGYLKKSGEVQSRGGLAAAGALGGAAYATNVFGLLPLLATLFA